MINNERVNRIKMLKVLLVIEGAFLLFWWPLSHWFYPNFYHQLLGFQIGSYQDSMVKVIGTCGAFPVFLSFAAAKNPIRNRDMIIILIILGILIGLTFLYLIVKGDFPIKEFINVVFCMSSAILLIVLYPWKMKSVQVDNQSVENNLS